MSELHPGARHVDGSRPVDPLDALRAADHRPVLHVWRERLYGRVSERAALLSGRAGSAARVFLGYAVAIGLAAALLWQLFAATKPPVEDSIPLARSTTLDQSTPTNSPTARVVDGGPDAPGTVGMAGLTGIGDEQPVEISALVVVHVAGAVVQSGLVSGSDGWRIDDAVRAAGGALPNADLDRLNLAALIHDGERIFVPAVGESEPTVVAPTGGSRPSSGGVTSASDPVVVDINTADLIELQALPGVGPATAATIVSHREQFGNFADVDALIAVRGIGPATLETLRDHVRVG